MGPTPGTMLRILTTCLTYFPNRPLLLTVLQPHWPLVSEWARQAPMVRCSYWLFLCLEVLVISSFHDSFSHFIEIFAQISPQRKLCWPHSLNITIVASFSFLLPLLIAFPLCDIRLEICLLVYLPFLLHKVQLW